MAWNSSTHKPVMVRPIRTTDAILIVSTLLRTGCYHGTRSVWPRHPVVLVSDDRPVVLVVDNVHDVGVVEDGCDDRVGVIRGDEWFDTDRGPRSARSPDPSPRGWCRSGHRPPPALAARVSSPRVRDPFLQGLAGELGNGLTLSGGDGSGALTQGCAG